MNTRKHTLTENSLILIISTAIVKIIGAVFKIPLATNTFLGDIGFGYYSVAHDIFMPFYILAISGLPSAVSQITAEHVSKNKFYAVKKNFKMTKKLFTALGLLFCIAVILFSFPLLISTSGKNTFLSIITIAPSILLCFVISAYRGYFEGFNNMYPTAISKIIEAVFKLFLGLALSYATIIATQNPALASAAAMLAVSFGTLASWLYLALKLRRNPDISEQNLKLAEEESYITVKSIITLAIPYVLASLSASIVSLVDVLTVKVYISNASHGYLQVVTNNFNIGLNDISTYLYGLRSKAFTLYYLIPTVTMSIGVGALPILTEYRTKNNTGDLSNSVSFSLKLISTFTFPAALGMISLSTPIMNLLYSSNDRLSGNLLLFYGVSAVFAGFAIPLTTIIQALDYHHLAVKVIIIGLVIKILFNIALVSIPSINIFAAPLGTAFCYLYMTVNLMIILYKKIGIIDFKNAIFKPFACALICGLSSFIISLISTHKIMTIFAIIFAVVIYFLLLIFSKAFTKAELLNIPLIKKFIRR